MFVILWMTAIQTASIESEIQTFSRDYYIQLSTAAARVSVQVVKSLGGHFACLCRGFEFYEVKKKFKPPA